MTKKFTISLKTKRACYDIDGIRCTIDFTDFEHFKIIGFWDSIENHKITTYESWDYKGLDLKAMLKEACSKLHECCYLEI